LVPSPFIHSGVLFAVPETSVSAGPQVCIDEGTKLVSGGERTGDGAMLEKVPAHVYDGRTSVLDSGRESW
jgi:hypothetical protein